MGDIVAIPLRGAWTGNRGNLHDRGTDIERFHRGSLWITCALRFRGWRLPQWEPGRFTLLFVHDELHPASWPELPPGTFVWHDGGPALVRGATVVPSTVRGYTAPRLRPDGGPVEVITPPATVAALRAGCRPQVDPAGC